MSNEKFEITGAQFLADMLNRSASIQANVASIQRSHRFPTHTFFKIENMAKMADVSVATIINQLIECGIESVYKELDEESKQKINIVTADQYAKLDKLSSDSKLKVVK